MAGLFAVLALLGPAFAQEGSSAAEDVWRARYVAALRVADDREARLLQDLDSERGLYLARIEAVARQNNVSQQTLAAAAIALGVSQTQRGRPVEPARLLAAIEENARRVLELEARLAAIEAGETPEISALFAQARTAIDVGELDMAATFIADTRALLAQRNAERRAQREEQADQDALAEASGAAIDGDVAMLRTDFRRAASLYAEAAERAPHSAEDIRWRYRMQQGLALQDLTITQMFSQTTMRAGPSADGPARTFDEATHVFQELALPLAPQDRRPAEWASTQLAIAQLHFLVGSLAHHTAILSIAIERYQLVLAVLEISRNRGIAMEQLATALMLVGRNDEARHAAQDALEVYEAIGDEEGAESARQQIWMIPP